MASWCGVKPTTGCVGSESTSVSFRYRSLSMLRVTNLGLPVAIMLFTFVSVSVGPQCAWEGKICVKVSASSRLELGV